DGAGKELVQTACTRCHGLDKFTGERHSRDDWREEVEVMIRYGAPLDQRQASEVTEYLARSFPGKAKPSGVRIPGTVEAVIKGWPVATPGARPHDPAVAPDGSVWYTGQANGSIGRLDPVTGHVREYPLTIPPETTRFLPYGVGPHGLVADAGG